MSLFFSAGVIASIDQQRTTCKAEQIPPSAPRKKESGSDSLSFFLRVLYYILSRNVLLFTRQQDPLIPAVAQPLELKIVERFARFFYSKKYSAFSLAIASSPTKREIRFAISVDTLVRSGLFELDLVG